MWDYARNNDPKGSWRLRKYPMRLVWRRKKRRNQSRRWAEQAVEVVGSPQAVFHGHKFYHDRPVIHMRKSVHSKYILKSVVVVVWWFEESCTWIINIFGLPASVGHLSAWNASQIRLTGVSVPSLRKIWFFSPWVIMATKRQSRCRWSSSRTVFTKENNY